MVFIHVAALLSVMFFAAAIAVKLLLVALVIYSFFIVLKRHFFSRGGKKIISFGCRAANDWWVRTCEGDFDVVLHSGSVVTRYLMILNFKKTETGKRFYPLVIFPDSLLSKERQMLRVELMQM